MHFLVAELLRAGFQHLEIVVAGQARDAVGAGDAHLVLGLGVPRLHFGERDRPIQEIGAGDAAIGALDLELVLVEAQRGAGPVRRRTADRLHDPCRKVRKIPGDAPASRCGAHVGPGELGKALPFIVDEVLQFDARAGLKDHDLDALLRKLVAERSAARAGAHDHDHAAVIQIEFCHVEFLPDCSLPVALQAFGSQSMSAKPRLM
jgi:hypothetical protein